MSGEKRRFGGWFLPVIVVAAGAYALYTAKQSGRLNAVALGPVNWAGLAAMVAGLVIALCLRGRWKLAGLAVCVVGAVMVMYL